MAVESMDSELVDAVVESVDQIPFCYCCFSCGFEKPDSHSVLPGPAVRVMNDFLPYLGLEMTLVPRRD